MAVASGSRLGPYEVLSLIGSGGMGEVYRARDSRLRRDVALKILPDTVSRDPDRLRRFEQEAHAVARLKHPNIISIYDIGTHGEVPYVVSELLEGETLRARLTHGPLSIRKATEYAIQIARGLATAHEGGVVHRDLKPENLFINADGRITILDFGLAKLRNGPATVDDTQNLTGVLETEPGMILGTVGYMSPEQVRGHAANERSDLFALGAILYEMVSGKRAFEGDSAADTMSAILHKDPPELSSSDRQVPPGLDRIVRHCLEKSPAERFQSARDVAFALESVQDLSSSSALRAVSQAKSRNARSLWAVVVLGVVAVGATAGFFAANRLLGPTAPTFRPITFQHGRVYSARFAPDGRTVVYGAAWGGGSTEIHSVRLEGLESRSLGLPIADVRSISASGDMAILVNPRTIETFIVAGTLARVPLGGGAPREILENVTEVDFAPNGTDLAIVRMVGERQRLEFPVGRVLYETAGCISHMRVSPSGKHIAFLDHPIFGDDRGTVALIDVSGTKKSLTDEWAGQRGLAWAPDGSEIWFTATRLGEDRELYAVALNGRQRHILRSPIDVALQDISPTGQVLLTREYSRTMIAGQLNGDTRERDFSWFNSELVRGLSVDGRFLLVSYYGVGSGSNYGLYLRRTDGSPAVRLGEGDGLALSPDGKWAFSYLPASRQFVLWPLGPGEARKFDTTLISGQRNRGSGWLPDGKHVYFTALEPERALRTYFLDVTSGKLEPVTPEGITVQLVSRDGKLFVAEDANENLFLYRADGEEAGTALPGAVVGDRAVQWANDDRHVFMRDGTFPASVYRLDPLTGQRTFWKTIGPADAAGVAGAGSIFITPDGRSHVYSYRRTLSDLYVAENLK